jgi:hypothetical protein
MPSGPRKRASIEDGLTSVPRILGRHGPRQSRSTGGRPTSGDPLLVARERDDIAFACVESTLYRGDVKELPRPVADVGVIEVCALPKRTGREGGVYVNVVPQGGLYGVGTLTLAVEAVTATRRRPQKASV